MKRVVVLKLGGELLEDRSAADGDRQGDQERGGEDAAWSSCTAAAARSTRPWRRSASRSGRSMACASPTPTRSTSSCRCWPDRSTRRFVAAINAAGGKAVGLTGADAGVAPVEKAAPHKATSGETVDLGMVGTPLKTAVARADHDALQGGLRPGDRLHQRVEERKVIQRQRRYVGGEPGGPAEGQAAGDRRRHAGRARQEEPDDPAARQGAHRRSS